MTNTCYLQCIDCPYGGDCDDNIRALPNFWGYVHEKKFAFQICPKGYCCPASGGCPSKDVCALHRRGRLCGTCADGYTKALFSATCVPDNTCSHTWLWSAIFVSGVACALLLVFHDDLFTFLSCSATWTHHRHTSDIRPTVLGRKRRDGDATKSDAANGDNGADCNTYEFTPLNRDHEPQPGCSTAPPESPGHDGHVETYHDDGVSSTALFIVLIYFYQDAEMLHVASTEDAGDNVGEAQRLPRALRLLAQFRRALAEFIDGVCFVPRLSTVHTLVARAALPAGVLFLVLLLLLLFSRCWRRGGGGCLGGRLSVAAALVFLFTYQRLALVALTLLNCVAVSADSVLFVDGSVVCLRPWQYAVLGYVLGGVAPFCGVFLLAPDLLQDGAISVLQFIAACVFPFPFILYWMCIRLQRRTQPLPKYKYRPLASVLHGPFRARCGAWPGVVVVRRLALVTLAAFVNNPLIRLLGMIVTIILSLLTLAHTRPYRSHRANVVDGATVSALFVVSLVNVVRAGFDMAEYRPRGPNRVLMTALGGIEDALVFWLPLLAVAAVSTALALKVLLLGVLKMRPLCATSRN